jgi:hypothetical protein
MWSSPKARTDKKLEAKLVSSVNVLSRNSNGQTEENCEKFEFPSRNLNLIRVYSLAGFQLLFQEATKSVPEPRLALN